MMEGLVAHEIVRAGMKEADIVDAVAVDQKRFPGDVKSRS
jgi:hypothetical protein